MYFRSFFALTFFVLSAKAANILVLSVLPSYSHHDWNNAIATGLGANGHNVTYVTMYQVKNPPKGVHYIHVEFSTVFEDYGKEISETKIEVNLFVELYRLMQLGPPICEGALKSDAFNTLKQYPDTFKFDLILHDFTMGPCFLPFMHKFNNPPLILTTAYTNPSYLTNLIGGNQYYSYVPHSMLPLPEKMNFWQRIYNFLFHVEETILPKYFSLAHTYDKMMTKYYGANMPSVEQMELRGILAFVNTHPVMDYPAPISENVIPLAGVHIKKVKPLPKDLEEFFNSSKKGVVLFSLGTLLRSQNMPLEKQQLFINVFAQLSEYNFLWKFESNITASELPKNIQIRPWIPQSDILGHPKLKTFITHGGLLSTQESVWRGVPIIVLPFAFDQHMNLNKVKKIGMAEGLDYDTLTEDVVRKTLLKILEDPNYAANAKKASAYFQDQKEQPLDRALWWVEWALRNPNSEFMKSPVPDLGYIAGNSIDIIAFVTLALATILFVTLTVFIWFFKKVFYGKPQKMEHRKRD